MDSKFHAANIRTSLPLGSASFEHRASTQSQSVLEEKEVHLRRLLQVFITMEILHGLCSKDEQLQLHPPSLSPSCMSKRAGP